IQLREWRWETSEKPVAWLGVLQGARTEASNLHIRARGRSSYNALRLSGNATWYLANSGALGKSTRLAIVDTQGVEVHRATLWQDFAALEFLFGTPLRLARLIGVNEASEPVAAYGTSFGYRYRADSSREPPLPDDRDHAWIAVAFPLLVKALAEAEPNPTTIATCGYVDSTVGHIDGQYLFAQVALEAAAYRLTTNPKPVVNDVDAWKAWARSQRPALEGLAADPAAVNVLAVKLRDAYRPTTSRLVLRKFQEMSIEPPSEALDEIEGRNVVAHTLSMTDGEPYEIERDLRRIRIVRSLLAGMILRHVGYSGALSGWDLDERRARKPADWFSVTSDATKEAQRVWEADATPEGDAGAQTT
ncbi:MAG TPA: hypothetical protein VM580_22865, partial [Labilithrix sp.]|nr:hypothetical protein [Labilithrix sp.]